MAEMNRGWQQINRNDHVQEYFYLGEFIQSDRWSELSPPQIETKNYRYLKDGFEYSGNNFTYNNKICVTEMTHATSLESMLSIVENGGFTSQEKYYPGIGPIRLVWFGLKIGEKEIDYMKENSNCRVQAQMLHTPELKNDVVVSKIARTPAFQPISRYGHFKFTIRIKEVLKAYENQFCVSLGRPEFRKLGTFAYKKETMHVILVCPTNTPGTDCCPLLSDDPVIQPDAELETWTWKPHSTRYQHVSFTGSGYPWFHNIRWEHVVFAFYVPNDSYLKIDDLEHSVSLCLAIDRIGQIYGVDADINMMLDNIASMEATKKKSMVNNLIRMIAGYLKEEGLYEKTMEANTYRDHLPVQLKLVVQRVQEILTTLEFDNLNWQPLTDWMNLLTRHKNVIPVIVAHTSSKKACLPGEGQ